jgi:hypothetical protein
MKRVAELYKTSSNGKKAVYIDVENKAALVEFLKSESAYRDKFRMIVEMLLDHPHVPRDLYDKEDFEKGCERVTAMKPTKGKLNPRIYCQQYSDKERKVFVIVVSEVLDKKKSQKLTAREKSIIRRVASYQYELKEK